MFQLHLQLLKDYKVSDLCTCVSLTCKCVNASTESVEHWILLFIMFCSFYCLHYFAIVISTNYLHCIFSLITLLFLCCCIPLLLAYK